MTTDDLREPYAEAVIELQSACADARLSFFAEMTTLIAAWQHARRSMGLPGPLTIDPPEPDPHEPSPAAALFRLAHGDGPIRPVEPPAPPTADGPGRMIGPRRSSDGRSKQTILGPTAAELYDYLANGGPPIRFPITPTDMVSTVKVRCYNVSPACATHRLIFTAEADHVTITRALR
jgi:hypothetical protein